MLSRLLYFLELYFRNLFSTALQGVSFFPVTLGGETNCIIVALAGNDRFSLFNRKMGHSTLMSPVFGEKVYAYVFFFLVHSILFAMSRAVDYLFLSVLVSFRLIDKIHRTRFLAGFGHLRKLTFTNL